MSSPLGGAQGSRTCRSQSPWSRSQRLQRSPNQRRPCLPRQSSVCYAGNENGRYHGDPKHPTNAHSRSPSPSTRASVEGNTERAFHSVDPFNSFDRGTLQEQGLWKTISKRTARTSPTCSTSSEGSKNLPPFLQKTMQNMSEWPGLEYIKYTYYNYRQGTWDDLKLFVGINAVILLVLALARTAIGDHDVWPNLYSTYKLIFGEFDDADDFNLQVFAVLVATGGFLGFALVLALVEQAFLEILEGNVRVGSPVFESNHILLLAFGRSPRDKEMLLTITRQLLHAHKDIGGTTIVIMTEVPKLELEEWFRKALGWEFMNSTLVFRQGNPLLSDDLRLVNAARTSATLILGDQSRLDAMIRICSNTIVGNTRQCVNIAKDAPGRGPVEADAQTTRIAVLLDEMMIEEDGEAGVATGDNEEALDNGSGHILVEVYNQDALELMHYSCSPRVIAVGTARLNARRLVRMLRQPIIGLTSRQMWDFGSNARAALEVHPELTGCKFGDVHFRFPYATPLGILREERMSLCPPDDFIIEDGDEIMLLRKSGSMQRDALRTPLAAKPDDWVPKISAQEFSKIPTHVKSAMSSTCDEEDGDCNSVSASNGSPAGQASGLFVMPTMGIAARSKLREEPMCVLIAGWKTQQFMSALAYELDRGQSKLPRGSHVTFLNEHAEECLEQVEENVRLMNVTTNHVYGTPLKKNHLARLDVTQFDCVMVLCDEKWMDPDENMTNGYDDINTQGDLLRLESVVLIAQLNIRMRLEAEGKNVGIVAEKMAYGGTTRFEDLARLPLGISVNFTSFSAKMLAFLAYYPKLLVPFFALGEEADITVFDSSWIVNVGEFVSYVQLQKRAMKLNHVLMGYYETPGRVDKPLQLVVNPQSADARLQERVWNIGIGHLKFLALSPCDSEPEDPLINEVNREQMPLDPDDFETFASEWSSDEDEQLAWGS